MAEITLADYAGYIFIEIVKAREMADRHSRALADVYAQDPVLKHFSVPRFKVPKMVLTIPVLISGARFNQVISFRMPGDKFAAYVNGRIQEVVSTLRSRRSDVFQKIKGAPVEKLGRNGAPRPAVSSQATTRFFEALRDNPDPSQPRSVVEKHWTAIFNQVLTEQKLLEVYKQANPANELYHQSLEDVVTTVTNNTVVDRTAIQSLLINPETNVVKNGSSDTSVFTISAELLEEGFFIRQIKDDAGVVRPIVEFE